jgi:beta-lactamase regulating signal transducer with metallopeptidase domain
MMSALNLHAVAQFSAERMLNSLVEGMAIALFGWLLLRIVGLRKSGHQNSGTRFGVWFVVLLAIATLPFVGILVPGNTAGSAGVSRSAITAPSSWATYLCMIWASIATLGLVRVGIGLWHVRRVRKNCVEIAPASLGPALRMTLDEFRSIRSVKVCVSDSLQVPTAIGFVKPVVALPAWAIRELSPSQLNTILLHELAHLRRWDDWTNLAQKLLRAVFFFHPAVWWIEGQLSLEREMACDDAVLAATDNPRAYAQCLVTVAEKSLMRRGLAMAQAAVSRVRQTSQRVAQILDANRPGATRVWKPAIGMVAVFAMVCAGLLSHSPELVSFQDKTTGAQPVFAIASAPSAHVKLVADHIPAARVIAARRSNRAMAKAVPETILAKADTAQRESENIPPAATKSESSKTQPELIPASFNASNKIGEDETSAKQQSRFKSVVLVYQGLEYDDAGFAHWTICVWRVTVPVQQPAITTNPAKST